MTQDNKVSILISENRYQDLLKAESTLQKVLEENYGTPVCFFWDKAVKKFYIPDKYELEYRGIREVK